MESFLSRYRNPLVLLIVVLAQMLGLAVQVRRPASGRDNHQTRLIRYWVVSLISPFERVFLFTGHSTAHVWDGYLDLRHVRAENQHLQAELNRMRMEQALLAESARQDLRLQKLLGFQQQYISKTVAAHVIGTSGTDLSRVLYIDKGSKDGIRTDMPVITPDGVVGKIRDVFPHTAQVLEINDQTSGLGIILTRTRLRGILRGTTAGQTEIVNILPDERIQPGDEVVTSGGDNIYPRGLVVGRVERIVPDPDQNPYVALVVKPAANLSELDEILVITRTQQTMPSTMQQDVDASEQKAADVLAQRLPGANLTPELGPDGKPVSVSMPPALVKPPAPLHPDRFTPGATPPADDLTPDASYQKQIFAPQTSAATAAPSSSASKTAPSSSASTTAPSGSASKTAPVSSQPAQKLQPAQQSQPARAQKPHSPARQAHAPAPRSNPPQEPQN